MRTTHLIGAFLALAAAMPALAAKAPSADDLETQLQSALESQGEDGPDAKGPTALWEAVEAIESAADASPKDARLQFLLGKGYFYLREDDKASAAYDRAIELAPKEAEYHFMKGVLLNYQEKPEEAAEALTAATELDPKKAAYWFELGTTYARAEKPDEATAAFERAVEADPKHGRAHLMIGVLKLQAGDEDGAMALFQKAAKADPDYVMAHYNIGQVHQTRGRHEDAIRAFKAASRLAPDDWRIRAKLVQEWQALGKTKERDAARDALFRLHDDGAIDAEMYCREQFTHGDERVMAFEYFELKGERAVRYSFQVLEPGKDEPKYKISLGSYDTTTQIARETDEIGPEDRIFHLDGYYPNGEHRTFGFYNEEPSYEDTREAVTAILEGKARPVSSSKPKGEGGDGVDVEIEVQE
jgi:tetratricopeptide (TPR) repeat protein